MKTKILTQICFILVSAFILEAQPGPRKVTGQRRYDVIITQGNDTVALNRSLRSLRDRGGRLTDRGLLADLVGGYLSLGTSTLLSASQNLIGAGISYIQEVVRDKRPDWEKATLGECRFVKHLPMHTEVLDFYSEPSTLGALDPTNMQFSGFGCRQYITIENENGEAEEQEVFFLSCKLRDDPYGVGRMLNHSKFEVVVDEFRFNPALCNLPNDTLSIDPSTIIDFDFDKRRDLEFNVVATVKSSWINEAIQVTENCQLGKFVITAKIDPQKIKDGIFTYKKGEDESGKVVVAMGESFLVPRSFTGYTQCGNQQVETWGLGQYKIEMDISETCRINEDYYTEMVDGKRKWNKDKWNQEWKLMKRRPKNSPMKASFVDLVFPSFTGDKWISTIIEPTSATLLKHEGQYVNATSGKLNTMLSDKLGEKGNGGASVQQSATGSVSMSQSGGTGTQSPGAPR